MSEKQPILGITINNNPQYTFLRYVVKGILLFCILRGCLMFGFHNADTLSSRASVPQVREARPEKGFIYVVEGTVICNLSEGTGSRIKTINKVTNAPKAAGKSREKKKTVLPQPSAAKKKIIPARKKTRYFLYDPDRDRTGASFAAGLKANMICAPGSDLNHNGISTPVCFYGTVLMPQDRHIPVHAERKISVQSPVRRFVTRPPPGA